MAARRQSPKEEPESRRPPAKSLDARERQLVALATDLVERKMRDGTATSQEVTHFLKLGSTRERLEQERLSKEIELLQSKTDQIAQQAQMADLAAEALAAMRTYSGLDQGDEDGA